MTEPDATSEENDHALVFRAKNGDNTAFDILMVRHQTTVSSCMRRYSAIAQTIEELTQTVFVKAYLNIGTYEPRAPFANWLRTIAYRVGLDYWRQEKKGRHISYHGDMDCYAERVAKTQTPFERFDELAQVINRLSPEDRLVLYMLYIDEHSVEEVANLMGWNRSMTKMRAFRARKRLRKILQSKTG